MSLLSGPAFLAEIGPEREFMVLRTRSADSNLLFLVDLLLVRLRFVGSNLSENAQK